MSIAIAYMHDDEEPLITFTEAEKATLPDSDEALHTLISAAKQCYRFLHPTRSGMSKPDCWTHYARSNYCAFQVIQRIDLVGDVDLDALCARLDIPHIDDTLPVLLAAYEQCRSIWNDTSFDDVIEAHAILDDIGDKMYPGCFDRDVYRQLDYFFADL